MTANPFGPNRVLKLDWMWHSGSWAEFFERFEANGGRGAIVGPPGSGKTTLLEAVAGQFARLGNHRIRSMRITPLLRIFPTGFLSSYFANLTPEDIVLVDGADELWRPLWWYFKHRSETAAGVIVTACREGLLPTIHSCRPDHPLLDAILARLLDEADQTLTDEARRLFEKHDGNLREVLSQMKTIYSQANAGSGVVTKESDVGGR